MRSTYTDKVPDEIPNVVPDGTDEYQIVQYHYIKVRFSLI